MIQTGPVTLGKDVFVGEVTVLDIETSMGDGAQLGHASSLHAGQAVPAGERWHGSPAQRTESDYRTVEPAALRHPAQGRLHGAAAAQRAGVYLPLAIGGAGHAAQGGPAARRAARPRDRWPSRSSAFYLDALVVSLVLFFGSLRRRPARRRHRPAGAQPRHQARQGLPPLRLPLLAPPHDRAPDQPQGLHVPLRRQLLHRQLPAVARVRPLATSSRPGRTSASR